MLIAVCDPAADQTATRVGYQIRASNNFKAITPRLLRVAFSYY